RKTSLLVFAILIPHNRQLQSGMRQWIGGSWSLHIRALPNIARIFPPHVGKCGQDTAGKAVQAAVHPDLSFERLAEILEEEVLANGSGDVFPGEDLVGATLAVSIEQRIEPVLVEGLDPGF